MTIANRGYDEIWNRLRVMILKREPICRRCKNQLAVMVDHIVSRRNGGERLNEDNLQPLCNKCHAIKTQEQDVQYTLRDPRWVVLTRRMLRAYPTCQRCHKQRATCIRNMSMDRDRYDPFNVVSVCDTCK